LIRRRSRGLGTQAGAKLAINIFHHDQNHKQDFAGAAKRTFDSGAKILHAERRGAWGTPLARAALAGQKFYNALVSF